MKEKKRQGERKILIDSIMRNISRLMMIAWYIIIGIIIVSIGIMMKMWKV